MVVQNFRDKNGVVISYINKQTYHIIYIGTYKLLIYTLQRPTQTYIYKKFETPQKKRLYYPLFKTNRHQNEKKKNRFYLLKNV